MKIFLYFTLAFISTIAVSKEDVTYYCSIEQRSDASFFHCLDMLESRSISHKISPIFENQARVMLEKQGVHFLEEPEYSVQVTTYFIEQVKKMGNSPSSCFINTAFRPKDFFSNEFSKKAVGKLTELVNLLKKIGICEIQIDHNDERNKKLAVLDNDSLMEHFLCIANYESALGEELDGDGGNGLFGIGSDTEKRCPGIKVKDDESNAICALELFKERQLADWGNPREKQVKKKKKSKMKTRSKGNWGSNHHCTPEHKTRFNFLKILGGEICCSEKCKKSVENNEVKKSI
jgi:hypothetical protein